MSTIAENINQLRDKIRLAAAKFQRDNTSINLLAVSKTHTAAAIEQAYAAGLVNMGENYLQEALEKQAQLTHLPLVWHFLGAIQSNKSKEVAENFSWAHAVDRLKIAERLSRQRPPELPPLNICLQVNISAEASKSGCSPSEITQLAQQVEQLANLRLRGLMVIPQPSDDFAQQRAWFHQTKELLTQINQHLTTPMDTLSMGMTGDMEAAIAEGTTWLRIGTAIFGSR